jgi:hypothetical protein
MAKINPFSNFTTKQPRQKHENQKKNVAELEEIKKALEYASVETQYLIKRGNILNADKLALDKVCVSTFEMLKEEQKTKKRRILEAEQTQYQSNDFSFDADADGKEDLERAPLVLLGCSAKSRYICLLHILSNCCK